MWLRSGVPHSVTGEDGPKDPLVPGSSPPHTSFQRFPVFPVQHRWAVGSSPPSHPLWQGWCFRILLGTVPQGQVTGSQCPQLCFPAGLPGAARPLGCPWTWPGQHQHPALCKAGVGTVTSPAQGCQRGWGPQGREQPLQGTRAVPLCQPCTVRGTRRSVIPLKKGASTGYASCHRPEALGFAPSWCCGCLQCQGSLSSVPGGGS